jgi:hypothetical protein
MSACAMFIIESDQGIKFVIQHNVKLLKVEFNLYLILVCGITIDPKEVKDCLKQQGDHIPFNTTDGIHPFKSMSIRYWF